MRVPRIDFRAAAIVAGTAFALLLAFLVAAPPGTPLVVAVDDLALTLAAALACASLAGAATRARGSAKVGWALLAMGAGSYTLGMLEWTRRQVFLGEPVPTPSLADLGLLAYIPLAAGGLLLLRARSNAGRLRLVLDAAAVALCVLFASLVLVILPTIAASNDGSGLELVDVIALAYPIGDVIMLTLAVAVAMAAPRADHPTLYLVTAGVASLALADSVYALLVTRGQYVTGLPTDALWFAGFILLTLAATRARRRPLATGVARPSRMSALIPSLAMGAVVLGLLVLHVSGATETGLHAPVIEFVILAILLTLIARHAVAAYDNAELVSELEAALVSVQAQVQERTAALSRSNEDLRHFASAASHDLQEPLRTVRSYTQLMERRYADKLDADGRDFLRFASDASLRMSRLIDGLLTYTRIDLAPQQVKETEVERALKDAEANLALALIENDATVRVTSPLPTLHADPAQLTLLFQNLVGNAIKYRGAAPPDIKVSAVPEQGAWRFVVEDNGIGIDPAFHERVFGIFQRLHTQEEREGSGIGLAVCRRIVERHGGRIWVESAEGAGAAFHFTLPDRGPPA